MSRVLALSVVLLLTGSGVAIGYARAAPWHLARAAESAQPALTVTGPSVDRLAAEEVPQTSMVSAPTVVAPVPAVVTTEAMRAAEPPAAPRPPTPTAARAAVSASAPTRTVAATVHPSSASPAPARSAPPATLAPSCPTGWFCYPRLGIAGTIVPYGDCTGRTDVGTAIRSFSCLSDRYLMAHGYTSFGRITGWQPGDRVSARGTEFTVTSAFTQTGCTAPRLPLAPLTLQTSLTAEACGPILIVQAH